MWYVYETYGYDNGIETDIKEIGQFNTYWQSLEFIWGKYGIDASIPMNEWFQISDNAPHWVKIVSPV